MKIFRPVLFFLLIAWVSGCATAGRPRKGDVRQILNTSKDETVGDAVTAMESVVESITKKDLTEEDVKRLSDQMRHDKEAQSAIQAISEGLKGGDQIKVKYSPATGKRYSPDMEYDPETGVKLLPVE